MLHRVGHPKKVFILEIKCLISYIALSHKFLVTQSYFQEKKNLYLPGLQRTGPVTENYFCRQRPMMTNLLTGKFRNCFYTVHTLYSEYVVFNII